MKTPHVNASAFELVLESTEGNRLSLGSFRGRKLLVSFLRNAQCAICNLWVHEVGLRTALWRDEGLDVVAVFESTVEKLRAQLDGPPPLTLLADPGGEAHDAFGSRIDPAAVQAAIASGAAQRWLDAAAAKGFAPRREEGSNFFRLPSEVLIRADGTVARIHVAETVGDHLPLEVIERFVHEGS